MGTLKSIKHVFRYFFHRRLLRCAKGSKILESLLIILEMRIFEIADVHVMMSLNSI